MNQAGYYRHATISGDTIAFVCEDDLWSWTRGDRAARRLTVGSSEISTPRLSPDGTRIAFVSSEEGHPEVSVMDALGSPPTRLTFLGGDRTLLCGWSADGNTLTFVSDAHAPFGNDAAAYDIPATGGVPMPLGLGSMFSLSRSDAGTVIGRNATDPARWKRYRGGTAGDLWVDPGNTGTFQRLITLAGNLVSPMWVNGRVYFLSDHEGIGNIYSTNPTGGDLQRHTDEREYFVRFPSTDGKRIVYTVAGAIKILDVATGAVETPTILAPSSAPQLARRFVDADDLLEDFSPSPNGERVALVSRGVVFTMPLWEEAVLQQAGEPGVRARAAVWLHDAKHIAYVTDQPGFERIEVRAIDGGAPTIITTESFGRVTQLVASPTANLLALANHRHELLLVDIDSKTITALDRSPAARIGDLAFSPDGKYLAYAASVAVPPAQANPDTSVIRVADITTHELHTVTSMLRTDRSPAWDPEGKYLYFISNRDFNPIYDALQFDLASRKRHAHTRLLCVKTFPHRLSTKLLPSIKMTKTKKTPTAKMKSPKKKATIRSKMRSLNRLSSTLKASAGVSSASRLAKQIWGSLSPCAIAYCLQHSQYAASSRPVVHGMPKSAAAPCMPTTSKAYAWQQLLKTLAKSRWAATTAP